MKTSKIILGIDPGTVSMGIGLISINGKKTTMIMMDVLRFSAKTDTYTRLQKIHNKVVEVINDYRPHEFAIEAPFYGKNVQSMLKLGRAQGVAIAAAMGAGIPVTEYSPRKIKQSITGNGNADKLQVLKMLQRILNFSEDPKYLDATDALAVAVCHHFQNGGLLKDKKALKGWEDFLAKNPERVR
ncbi:MAG: crossover junction endodeoxyribonuclease RuvC [Chitinophagaceae bacterium]|nr:crossover junction endodeoxyribonuclease RuvC [Chitinophagaceae bacterium]